MSVATYTIVAKDSGWGVHHDGAVGIAYATKETAFEAAASAASNAIKNGYEVRISVPGRDDGEPALGAR
jgi:hypothetical protein